MAVLLLGSAWREARGEDVIGYVEVGASEVDTRNAFPGVPVFETDQRSTFQRVNVTWTRLMWPRLMMWTGGTFDHADTRLTGDAAVIDSEITELRPFFGLRRTGPRQNAQVLWTRDQRTTESAPFPETELTRDSLFASYNWNPVRGPETRASYTHNTESDDRGVRDLVSTLADLALTQRLLDERVRATYRGTYTTQDDAVGKTEVTTTAHRAGVQYDDAWVRDRVWFHSEYLVTRRDTELVTQGQGELVEPLFPTAGLSARDATPLDGPLAPLAALIDTDTTTGTGIDLGLPGPGDDTTAWSLGLDFGDRTSLDALDVFVDRTIDRPSVITALTWRLYVSEDNQIWLPSQVLTAARFDDFQRRLELRFTPVVARYVKLVVEPLAPSVPFADEFPDLFVTELAAGRRLTTPGTRLQTEDTIQTLTVDTRARLMEARALFYEGSFRGTDSSRQDFRWRASNGLSFVQPFAQIWTVSARGALEQERQATRERQGLVYSTSLAVEPLPRLRWTAAFSGRQDTVDGLDSEQNSVFLYGSAGLYQGVDVQIGVGRSYLTSVFGDTTVADQVDLSAIVVPRPELTLGFVYTDTDSERVSGDLLGLFDIFTRTAEFNAAWTPFPTTYLYGSYRLEWRTDTERDEVTNLVLSWSPFPMGSFRFSYNYYELRRTLLQGEERVYGPSLRWDLNRRSYLQLSYRSLEDFSFNQRLQDDVATATLRWGF